MINNVGTSSAKNPYSMFTKTDYTSNAQYLSNTYGTKPQYYDDVDIENAKKARNKKRNKLLIFGSVGLLAVGAVVSALAYGKKIPTDKLAEQFKKLADSTQDGFEELTKQSKGIFDKVQNLCVNFTTVKDAYWRKLQNKIQKIPILNLINKGCDAIDDVYSKTLLASVDKKAQSILGERKDEILTGLFGKDGLNGAMEKLNGAFKKGQAVNGLINKEQTVSKVANTVLSTSLRKKVLEKNYSFKEIIKNIGSIQGLDEKQKAELTKLINEEFLPKAADIANGCAPTDIITSGIPIIGFSAALATADSKEERKKTLIDLGIPLLPTCFMPIVGLKFPILNGFKGLVACLAAGQVAKGVVLGVNKIIEKTKNKGTQET